MKDRIYKEDENRWNSITMYIMLIFSHTIGFSSATSLAGSGINSGLVGHAICFFAISILFGIPYVYMQLVIGQFTGRDCLEVWKARPFLSYVGHVILVWQFIVIVFNVLMASYSLQYTFLSFEHPPPFSVCGHWSNSDCDILKYNQTVYTDCLKADVPKKYCYNKLELSFPESQYFKIYLKQSNAVFHINKQLCLSSFLICVFIFLSCFQKEKSLKHSLWFLTLYPVVGYMLVLFGSMLQKGFLTNVFSALDADFSLFYRKFKLSNLLQQSFNMLNVGSGVTVTVASTASFRTPCYTAAVVSVVAAAAFNIMMMYTTAMMACPVAHKYGISAHAAMSFNHLSSPFERTPMLLDEFEPSKFYLIVAFSSNTVLALRVAVIVFFNFLEMAAKRYESIAKNIPLVSIIGTIVLYFVNIPLMSNIGLNTILILIRKFLIVIPIIIGFIECLNFMLFYGIGRFSEDIHFMLGYSPPFFVKVIWAVFSAIALQSLYGEVYRIYESHVLFYNNDFQNVLGIILFTAVMGLMFLSAICILLYGVYKKRFRSVVQLDRTWGPKNEILRRSRTMFSARAVTKEYMYRQHHLQAGIIDRQRRANVRDPILHFPYQGS